VQQLREQRHCGIHPRLGKQGGNCFASSSALLNAQHPANSALR
jgi:hypothetical protein